jgi:hypothetical protein
VREPSFVPLLATLNEHGVEYFVVGALAAVLQGAPVVTFDVDIERRKTWLGCCALSTFSTPISFWIRAT